MSHTDKRSSSKPPEESTAETDAGAGADLARILRDAIFAEAAEEDLAMLDAPAREWLARRALKLLQGHKPGRARVRLDCYHAANGAPAAVRGLCLLRALNDDMPFLVDSLRAHLAAKGVRIHLLLHPILHVRRDARGALISIERRAGRAAHLRAESLILALLELPREDMAGTLAREIRDIFAEVHDVVLDWPVMRARLQQMIDDYQRLPPPVPVSELTETLAFLQWLAEDHFVFLGTREYVREGEALRPTGQAHGILRRQRLDELTGAPLAGETTPVLCLAEDDNDDAPVIVTKSALVSRVHRRVPMDLVVVRRFDVAGNEVGELRVLGLFTAGAYVRAARDIPLLRRKIAQAMRHGGVTPDSHRGKALLNILETFPRDDLFELNARTLARLGLRMLAVRERPRPHLIVWRGCSPLFASAFAFIPRERFGSELRRKVGALLETALGARVVEFQPSFGEDTLVRVHFRLRLLKPGHWRAPDMAELNRLLRQLVQSWEERLLEELRTQLGADRAERLWPLWRDAFSAAWREAFSPRESLRDILMIEHLAGSGRVGVALYRARGDAADQVRLKLYHFDEAVPLSRRVPMLANMGLHAVEERTFTIRRGAHAPSTRRVFIHEMLLRPADDLPLELERVREVLEQGFLAVWNGQADDDRFNALMLAAGLDWRRVMMLRAIGRWLRQAGVHYALGFMADTLRKHHAIARACVEMFEALFAPGRQGASTRRRRAEEIWCQVLPRLAQVPSLDEDRVLRMYGQVILAMRRTNFWQSPQLAEGDARPLLFKLRGEDVDFIPAPRPWAEVFVHDPALEAVHLRGGPIARGGIRFSDRQQDFRTEILGLMKAQTIKNAVIVPVGAKGGFVLRHPPAGRDALREEGARAYARFIGTVLDITDDIAEDGTIVPPERVVRLDGDDPYFVVAADKGTATFSDLANALARRRGYWLDDAFASGGSAGYDHKKMGITARGAWVCVRRHFQEMGVDVDDTSISVIGIGDMSGDVFGNGMLIQPNIRLLAAFDHRDIFIDPDPDPATAHAERKRLFRLPGSSWQDYDRTKISPGGGVFSRKAKSIPLSPQMKHLLNVQADALTPDELIRAILKMPADLLWFGGIGTFVCAAAERDSDVGDPANDAIRITAEELRVKVVGEGANLGMTQRARIAYALAGGRVNMDAIDNSGGVNCSDLEVNIKIALSAAERAGHLDRPARDGLLKKMEKAVTRLVLANNLRQHLCISMSAAQGAEETEELLHLMRTLERRGALNRAVEALPTDEELRARLRAGGGLTRPEIAVLMSWAKIVLFDDLLACGVVDDAHFETMLLTYFPPAMRERFADEIRGHRLRREIIANRVGNAMINEGGPALVVWLAEETGRDVADIARAWALARSLLDVEGLMQAIDRLQGHVRGPDQLRLYLDVQRVLRRATAWLLRHDALTGDIDTLLAGYRPFVKWLAAHLGRVATSHAKRRLRLREQAYRDIGAPRTLARALARLPYMLRGLEMARVQTRTQAPPERIARVYFLAGQKLRLSAVIMAARRLELPDHESRLAARRLVDRLGELHMALTARVCALGANDAASALQAWLAENAARLARLEPMLDEVLSGPFSLARLALAASLLEELLGDDGCEDANGDRPLA